MKSFVTSQVPSKPHTAVLITQNSLHLPTTQHTNAPMSNLMIGQSAAKRTEYIKVEVGVTSFEAELRMRCELRELRLICESLMMHPEKSLAFVPTCVAASCGLASLGLVAS
jgi:hypothetical protein